jgi:acyl-CoA synthetase (AMP-forming)/AMP-acid ligase II
VWLENIIENSMTVASHDKHPAEIVLAYLSSNSIDLILSVLASTADTFQTVIIPVLLNSRWTSVEMIHALTVPSDVNSQPSAAAVTILLHDRHFADMARNVRHGLADDRHHAAVCREIPSLSRAVCVTFNNAVHGSLLDSVPSAETSSERKQQVLDTARREDAVVLFTSGTTGGSKGVRLGHRALLIQALAKLDPPCAYSHRTCMLASTVPLFHVGGLSSVLAVLMAGGTLVFPERSNGNSPASFQVQDIALSMSSSALFSANTLVVVPAMLFAFFTMLDAMPTKHHPIYPQTRLILIGGQSASDAVLQRVRYTFPNANIVQTYACTEAASSLTFLSIKVRAKLDMKPADDKPSGDCVGTAPRHIELQLMDQQHHESRNAPGAVIRDPYKLGVIATRGPHVMNGYWKRGSRDEPVGNFVQQWFIGGDLGFWDEQGRLHFGGRIKDIIRSGGETVMAQEVERVVQQHPLVIECAVFPQRDERFGEAVACVLVTKESIGMDAMKKWCKTNGLAGYKQPKYLYHVSSLPRNSSGKILKHKLMARFGMKPHSRL